jgi:hypothetical protein
MGTRRRSEHRQEYHGLEAKSPKRRKEHNMSLNRRREFVPAPFSLKFLAVQHLEFHKAKDSY